jgi:hypothetical protein
MPALRKFVIASAVAIAGAVTLGTAQAAPADTSIAPAYNGLYYGDLRYCYLPFYRMVDLFGYGNAIDLKISCRRNGIYRHY